MLELPPASGSEVFGQFGSVAGVPSVFWFTGGVDPARTEEFTEAMSRSTLPPGTPSNHSPKFAPSVNGTITTGVRALQAAALAWLGTSQ